MSYGGFEYGNDGEGGGGYGGGAFGGSQPGGGGYMTGGAVDSPAGGGSSGGGQRNRDKLSIIPVNIMQVLKSEMPSQDAAVKIDGVDVAQIKLVGCIVDLQDASTNTEYTIEDTTGRLKIKIFHNDGEGANDRSAERRALNQLGTYVRVFGNIRSWKGDRHSVASDMQPISDFNEVTMHALEVIYTHLFNTKGPLPGKATIVDGENRGSAAMGGQYMQGMGSPSFNGQGGQAFGSPLGNVNHDIGGGSMHMAGFTDIQQKVLEMFQSGDNTEHGHSTDTVIRMLTPSGISPHDVRQAIQFLASEGHLYTTTDDDHHRTTAS